MDTTPHWWSYQRMLRKQKLVCCEQHEREAAIAAGCWGLAAVAVLVALFWTSGCFGAEVGYTDSQLANAIFKAEGGLNTRYPYGVKSIETHGDRQLARRICLNSIRNSRVRWAKAGNPGDFIAFFGSRWCPPKAHPLNKNWVGNVRRFLEVEKIR